jgi:hypothetical protein
MSSSDQEKQRNREIAQNEAAREAVSAVRVSSWARRSRSPSLPG